MNRGYVDLHCHYLPAIDDGARTLTEGVAIARGLASLGFETVIATPHIRTVMFENRRPGLQQAFSDFERETASTEGMPQLGLGAEHHFDDTFWELFQRDELVPYPGQHAALVEFPERAFPVAVDRQMFNMMVRGLRPVLAHPERYAACWKNSDSLIALVELGTLPLLDVMALVGKYGRKPQRTAQRLLDEGIYYAACSDAHRPEHIEMVSQGIEELGRRVGPEIQRQLLAEHPRAVLQGSVPQ